MAEISKSVIKAPVMQPSVYTLTIKIVVPKDGKIQDVFDWLTENIGPGCDTTEVMKHIYHGYILQTPPSVFIKHHWFCNSINRLIGDLFDHKNETFSIMLSFPDEESATACKIRWS